MYLKALQIKGFKSFADTATLDLEPGVTVVVGPNGSGKSNVVDAIGWVLGAQAPSAVRSQKMDDVIFAGSSKRPALGRAEVSLTIDNSDGLIPVDFSEITISRVLFRSGDSEYSINGVSCRLLDIQELLSDSGVGRQQHVIISQGQIDAVLNARPEDRRLIIEEAAGVLKFRRRKEKAERRLAATEANLTRIQDTLRELRRQLKPLERQADAARRHADVVAELQALRVVLAGRDLARLRAQLRDSTSGQAELRTSERAIRAKLAALDTEVIATEARLSGLGGPDVSDVLMRYESLRERARGLSAVLVQRQRGVERDRDAFVDQAVVASLESERVRCSQDLADVEHEAAAHIAAALEADAAEQDLADAQERFESEWAERSAPEQVGDLKAVRAEFAAARSAADRAQADANRLASQRSVLDERRNRRTAEHQELLTALDARRAERDELHARVQRSAVALADATAALNVAEADHEAALAERHRWIARADALSLALDEARQRAGAERLEQIDGVVGTLLDVIEIDPGWEAAVEAAAADVLAAVVADSVDSARLALDALNQSQMAGALLAATGLAGVQSVDVGSVGEPVRAHVRGIRPGVDDLLDRVLAGAVLVSGSWDDALNAALEHPELTVVTSTGDRFSSRGWALRAAGSGATGAALEEATAAAAAAVERADQTAQLLAQAKEALTQARSADAAATRASEGNDRTITQLETELARLGDDSGDVDRQLEALDAHCAELLARADQERARAAEVEQQIPALEAVEAQRADHQRQLQEARRQLEDRARSVAQRRAQVSAAAAAVEERRRSLEARLVHLEERLTRHQADRLVAERRHQELDARSAVLDHLAEFVAQRAGSLDGRLDKLRAARHAQSERTRALSQQLDNLRRDRVTAERELEVVRERLQRAEVGDAETKLRLEALVAHVRNELDCEPDAAIGAQGPLLPEGVSPSARVRELERDIRMMGPINPLALEEFEALKERNAFFEQQLEDIRQTRRELAKVIRAVDEEIVSVFSAAYADVSQNFTALFETLFPGGQGRLRLTDPHDVLRTGIEIEAKPSGKNVKKLSLLSGGERSLTALAYLFAVFRSRPSPFYVMDEVEAALDDVNLHRFLGLVAEFRDAAQLIIVSHQKRTMEAADVLYGVTMEPGGSSKVVSERVSALLD